MSTVRIKFYLYSIYKILQKNHNLNFIISNIFIYLTNFILAVYLLNNFDFNFYANIVIIKITIFINTSICSFGFNQSYILLIRKNHIGNQDKYQSFNTLISAILTIFVGIITLTFISNLLPELNRFSFLLIILIFLLNVINLDFLNRYRAKLLSISFLYLTLIRGFVFLILIGLFIKRFADPFQIYLIAYLITELIITLSVVFLFKDNYFKISYNRLFFKIAFFRGIKFNLILFLFTLFQYCDRFLIKIFGSSLSLSKYDINAAYSFAFIGLISKSVHQYLLPIYVSNYHLTKLKDKTYILNKYLEFYTYLSIICILILILFYKFYINFFSSVLLQLSYLELIILILSGMLFHYVNLSYTEKYRKKNFSKILLDLSLALLINIGITTPLIIFFNFEGAILGIFISSLFLFIISKINYLILKK